MKRPFLIILAALSLLTACRSREEKTIVSVPAADAAQREAYFASHGWKVEEISVGDVIIPADFSGIYEEYAEIQDRQGLPLREYAGKNAKLYVYEVKNYSPESRKMLAELLVCNENAVASLIYSEDGISIKMPVS